MELSRLNISNSESAASQPATQPSDTIPPKFESAQMSRQDSGFSDGVSSSRRTSMSSTSRRKRHSNSISRPTAKRSARSSPSTVQARHLARPNIRSRHTAPPHQFFQFPTLPAPQSDPIVEAAPPPPPATCHYWTSDSTRRLEYAAIDAASKGVRGFFIKLVPDCILPPSSRRTKFHDDADSDAGSVRRYRLDLPEEKDAPTRPSLLKRWTGFGRSGS
ncbi:hypothetical protein B0O99DRAFT_505263 [Bisporella sp. PMI_857]|nr:hypothetical protein B0O99DRAFT_505263 [Bisporella sp. PMI_857]